MGITAPLKIGYSDGSGIDTLCITDAHDELVVWGHTELDFGVSGVKDQFAAAQLIQRFNAHDALVAALEDAKRHIIALHPGGDQRSVNREYGDETQMAVLDQLDAALHLAKHGASTNEEAV